MTTKGSVRSSRGRRGRSTRSYAWFNNQSVPISNAPGVQGLFDMLPLTGVPDGYQGGQTVMRMLLKVWARPAAVGFDSYGALGVYAGPRDSLVIGAPPDPLTDLVDWYFHTSWYINQSTLMTELIVKEDIRSARKIRGEDRTLGFVIDPSGASGTAITWSVSARLLLSRS